MMKPYLVNWFEMAGFYLQNHISNTVVRVGSLYWTNVTTSWGLACNLCKVTEKLSGFGVNNIASGKISEVLGDIM